jgi:hypothetical protein
MAKKSWNVSNRLEEDIKVKDAKGRQPSRFKLPGKCTNKDPIIWIGRIFKRPDYKFSNFGGGRWLVGGD